MSEFRRQLQGDRRILFTLFSPTAQLRKLQLAFVGLDHGRMGLSRRPGGVRERPRRRQGGQPRPRHPLGRRRADRAVARVFRRPLPPRARDARGRSEPRRRDAGMAAAAFTGAPPAIVYVLAGFMAVASKTFRPGPGRAPAAPRRVAGGADGRERRPRPRSRASARSSGRRSEACCSRSRASAGSSSPTRSRSSGRRSSSSSSTAGPSPAAPAERAEHVSRRLSPGSARSGLSATPASSSSSTSARRSSPARCASCSSLPRSTCSTSATRASASSMRRSASAASSAWPSRSPRRPEAARHGLRARARPDRRRARADRRLADRARRGPPHGRLRDRKHARGRLRRHAACSARCRTKCSAASSARSRASSSLGLAIGALIAPLLLDVIGIRASLIVVGAMLPVLAVLLWRRLRSSTRARTFRSSASSCCARTRSSRRCRRRQSSTSR